MSKFGGIGKARGFKSGKYFEPGNHRVRIERCKYGKTRRNVEMFVVECEILESDNEKYKSGGEKASYLVTMDKDGALGNVADFMRVGLAALATANGEPTTPDQIDGDELEFGEDLGGGRRGEPLSDQIVDEANILAGVVLDLYVWVKTTQKGNPFSVHEFSVPSDAAATEAA